MAYRDGHAPSPGSKLSLLFIVLLGALLSTQLIIKCDQLTTARQILLIICTWSFLIRLAVCLLRYVQRKVSWFEGIAVGVLYCGMLYAFALWGSEAATVTLALDVPGIALYVGGSWINTLADHQRHAWKSKSENSGRLFTQGLFRYAVHINFFGDTLMFLGFAAITHNITSFVPVVAIIANFLLYQIPQLDGYLKSRYGKEFVEYSSQTKKYVPLVY